MGQQKPQPKTFEEYLLDLRSEDRMVRWRAVDSLGKLGDIRAIEPLMAILSHPDNMTRHAVVNALGHLGNDRALDALLSYLRDEDFGVRAGVVVALGQLQNPRVIDPILNAISDVEWYFSVGGYAMEGLSNLGEVGVKPLIASLDYDNSRVRAAIVYSLGMIGDNRAFEHVLLALNDEVLEVRTSAIVALGQLKDERAIEPLVAILRREITVEIIAMRVLYALSEIGTKKSLDILLDFLKDTRTHIRLYAIQALGRLKDEQAIKPLIANLQPNDEFTWSIVFALGELKASQAIEPLLTIARTQPGTIRQASWTALSKIDFEIVFPLLKGFLFSDDCSRSDRDHILGILYYRDDQNAKQLYGDYRNKKIP